MTQFDIMEALNHIDQELIMDAKRHERCAPRWLKWAAIAACVSCLISLVALSLGHISNRSVNPQQALTTDKTTEENKIPRVSESALDFIIPAETTTSEEDIFFDLFRELDQESMRNYVEAHPEVLSDGWMHININEAGLDDTGTEIMTTKGDQVLAINANAGIILIRIKIESSRGILAICKETSRLRQCSSANIGISGQTIGEICEDHNGLLAITGSAFVDDENSSGGTIAGLAVCSGITYGVSSSGTYKRLELRNDNRMYIVDSITPIGTGTRDACEFTPALIIDGEIMVDENCGWTSLNPRAALGQNSYFDTMMVVVEGRLTDSPGCSVVSIAELMASYDCVQAMNLDGGTSAIMYYDGEYVTRCSNTALPSGRKIPTAWVYR